MTREEFRDYVDFLRSQNEISYDVYSGLIDGIDTLEQEPILDKIRAEIELIERYGTVNGHDIWLRTPEEIKKEVLKIIDKYKAESEGQSDKGSRH